MSISLPTLQKELGLEPADLQWVISAYSLSSVRDSLSGAIFTLPLMVLIFSGLLTVGVRASGGPVWAEAKLPAGNGDTRGVYPRLRIR